MPALLTLCAPSRVPCGGSVPWWLGLSAPCTMGPWVRVAALCLAASFCLLLPPPGGNLKAPDWSCCAVWRCQLCHCRVMAVPGGAGLALPQALCTQVPARAVCGSTVPFLVLLPASAQ